jgi:hypothetical protein
MYAASRAAVQFSRRFNVKPQRNFFRVGGLCRAGDLGPTAATSCAAKRAQTRLNTGGVVMQRCYAGAIARSIYQGSDPNGIRTRVTAVKGRCPRPLDDRVKKPPNIRIDQSVRKANCRYALRNAGDTPAATDLSTKIENGASGSQAT